MMNNYKHVLLAVELDPSCDNSPVHKAAMFAKECNAKLTLVHAIEHMSSYGAAYGVAAGADIEEMLLTNAKEAMAKLGEKLSVDDAGQVIKVGPAATVILDEAEHQDVDLIIVGSHGRHGIRLLLGSTANAVLHGSKVDVLAVRVKA